MKRHLIFAFIFLAVAAVSVTACGGQPAQANVPDSTGTPLQTAETPPDNTSTGTPVAVSHGGPVEDYVSLIDNLRAAGATVEPAGEIEQVFFSVRGQIIRINGADVQVFEYPDAAASDADAALVAPDGGSVGTTMITWVEAPHFYKTGKLIVLYVGTDSSVTSLLDSVIGPQFAGR